MQKHFLTYQSSPIHYHVFGKGEKLMFCIHGYGEDGTSFYFLKPALGNDYTLIAIDLPFHGSTTWNEGPVFSAADLINIIRLICQNYSSSLPFSLLGYSMGGRICMHLAELIPQQIERMVLVAPDGLHKNFWYGIAAKNALGNKLFRYTMHHPEWLFTIMKAAHKTGMLTNSIHQLAHFYLDDAAERLLLYKRWTCMQKFEITLPVLKEAIRSRGLVVRMLFGSHDKIILGSKATGLNKGLENLMRIKTIDAGHRLLKEKHAAAIAAMFYE